MERKQSASVCKSGRIVPDPVAGMMDVDAEPEPMAEEAWAAVADADAMDSASAGAATSSEAEGPLGATPSDHDVDPDPDDLGGPSDAAAQRSPVGTCSACDSDVSPMSEDGEESEGSGDDGLQDASGHAFPTAWEAVDCGVEEPDDEDAAAAVAPLYDGCAFGVFSVVFMLQQLRRKFGLSERCMEDLLKLLAGLLPAGHRLPTTLYRLNKLSGVANAQQHIRHVCTSSMCTDGYVWPYLPPKQYTEYEHDKCPHCETPRFQREERAGKSTLVPVSWYIELGLERALRAFGACRAWMDARRKSLVRDAKQAVFWATKECSRLRDTFNSFVGDVDAFDRPDVALLELLLDWCQPYNSSQHSTGILSVRCSSLYDMDKCRDMNVQVLAVIPGPKCPKLMAGLLRATIDAFAALGKAGVRVRCCAEDGSVVGHAVRPVLSGILADTQARVKLSNEAGVGAYAGCGTCFFTGQRYTTQPGRSDTGSSVYYKGYAKPAPQFRDTTFKAAAGAQSAVAALPRDMRMDDPAASMTVDKLKARLAAVQARHLSPREVNYRGLPPMLSALPYLDIATLFLVPLNHALLFGVVRKYVDYMFATFKDAPTGTPANRVLTKEQLALIKQAGKQLETVTEHGRRYRCICDYRKSWSMEEWLTFVEVYSPIVFREHRCLPPLLFSLWELLAKATAHYCRLPDHPGVQGPPVPTPESWAAHALRGRSSLQAFARIMEEHHFPDAMFTYNLHMLVCRLSQQEAVRGCSVKDQEYQVERTMQQFKSHVGRRVCDSPEITYGNQVLLLSSMQAAQLETVTPLNPTAQALLTSMGWMGGQALTAPPPRVYTDGDRRVGGLAKFYHFLGKGHKPTADEDAALRAQLPLMLSRGAVLKELDWVRTPLPDLHTAVHHLVDAATCYHSAQCGPFGICAKGQGRSRKRVNYWVQVDYASGDDGKVTAWPGMVRCLVSIPHYDASTSMPGAAPLRLALVDLYKPLTPAGRALRAKGGQPDHPWYPVELACITKKLVSSVIPGPKGEMQGRDSERWFVPFSSVGFDMHALREAVDAALPDDLYA